MSCSSLTSSASAPNYTAIELEAACETRALRPSERLHSFVMADNPYQAKQHRTELKAKRLEAIRKGAKKAPTLSGKLRRRPIVCAGDGIPLSDTEARQGVGDIRCIDGTLRRPEASPLRGLRRVSADEHGAKIVLVTEPKVFEPKAPTHPDGTEKQPEEMTDEEKTKYVRQWERYVAEGQAMVECIVLNASLDAAALCPKSIEYDFEEPGEAARRYGREAHPTVYI